MSIAKDFSYKAILNISNYILGFITFPYITRVLGSEYFGIVNFALGTIDYFMIFASLGIATIGIREISSQRHDTDSLSRTFSRIIGLNAICTIIVCIIYFCAVCIVPRFHDLKPLFLIGSSKIIFFALTIEWFYCGLEKFKYITICTLIIKCIYVLLVFIIIKSSADYLLYFVLTISITIISGIINILYSRKYVTVVWSEFIKCTFIKENIILGLSNIMTSMYLSFNIMFLGLVASDTQVGYYSAAFKLYFCILSIFGAFTSVMQPKMSYFIHAGASKEFNENIRNSFNLILLFSPILIVCCIILAPEIISVLSGDSYRQSISLLRISVTALLPVSVAQVILYQVLIPLRKDRYILFSSICSGILALSMNIIFVPKFLSTGSVLTLITAEYSTTLIHLFYISHNKILPLPSLKMFAKGIVLSIPGIITAIIAQSVFSSAIIVIAISASLISVYCIFIFRHFKSRLKFYNQN